MPSAHGQDVWYYAKEKDGPRTERLPIPDTDAYRLYITSELKTEGESPSASYDVPIDIIATSYFPSNSGIQVGPPQPNSRGFRDSAHWELTRHRVEPLVGGVSLGNERGSAGTLGAIVWDTRDARPCILSNWHVLSSTPGSQVGQPCFQPALSDGGQPEHDRVGHLKRWIFNRTGDAALADLDGSRYYSPTEVLGLWHPIIDAVEPHLGMTVRKWGRASNYTEGFVDGIDLALNVEYREVGLRFYDKQFHIAPLRAGEEVSIPGDSGALWVTKAYVSKQRNRMVSIDDAPLTSRLEETKAARVSDLNGHQAKPPEKSNPDDEALWMRVYLAVGLHFAGDVPGAPVGEHAVATPILKLCDELSFSFRPVFPHPDHCIEPQGRFSDPPRVMQPRAAAPGNIGPARQIDTGFRRRGTGPQPDPDPVNGHP